MAWVISFPLPSALSLGLRSPDFFLASFYVAGLVGEVVDQGLAGHALGVGRIWLCFFRRVSSGVRCSRVVPGVFVIFSVLVLLYGLFFLALCPVCCPEVELLIAFLLRRGGLGEAVEGTASYFFLGGPCISGFFFSGGLGLFVPFWTPSVLFVSSLESAFI